jgi:heme-degrading monooxygenase HmoA
MAAPFNMALGMASLMMNPVGLFREMVGVMSNPLNMLTLSGRLLSGGGTPGSGPRAGGAVTPLRRERSAMYSHVIELTAKPGRARDLVNAIRDQAIPQFIRGSRGFVDEIVLLSDTDPNHVTAISFWRSKEDAAGFTANGFERVSALLQPFLSARPERHEFVVGASTNRQIEGWGA